MKRAAFAGLVILAACGHEAPFTPEVPQVSGPRTTTPPIRLTYNDGDDRTPAWLPDGSAIIYSSERLDLGDADRCLNLLPAGGGAVTRELCARGPSQDDSTHRFESPAVAPGFRIAFLRAVSTIGLQKGPAMHLMIGTADDPAAASPVTIIPYASPSGRTHGNVSHLTWLNPTRLVYLGEDLFYQGSTFLPDTFSTGLEIVRLETAPLSFTIVPGTEYASSVAAGGDEDTIVYTLGGDSRVYSQSLSTGAVSVLHDFGAAGIVRDAQLRGNTLVAVVGRSVLFQFEDAHGWVQRDEGGDLHIVDLAAGTSIVHSLPDLLFRRPALSPDGASLVVEVSPFAPVHVGPVSDFNATNHRPDLWLFELQ
ncbi:MAG TPA: hypothetical protein VFT04_03760 [Gemmatimonadales bacterium]|nr:hypothetical protein [Gemmatimonadales bacterium]